MTAKLKLSEYPARPEVAERELAVPSIVPGVLLTSSFAAMAFLLRLLPGVAVFSPMIIAILIGTGFHNLYGTPTWAKAGVKFSLRRILRAAIILLGFQLTVEQIAEVGGRGFAIVAASLVATFFFTVQVGRLFGVDRKLAQLIGAGTSICGASAVIAANTVTEAPDEDVTYAVACVTVFGSIAMFTYPLLSGVFHLNPHSFGLWSGSSIHEIAQVVAAAFQNGQEAGEFGTIAKLSRVMLLAPMILAMGFLKSRDTNRTTARTPLPWFVLGFVAVVGINSVISMPAEVRGWIVAATTFSLSIALAAMGLETDIRKLAAKGLGPAMLGGLSWVFIAGVSLLMIKLTS